MERKDSNAPVRRPDIKEAPEAGPGALRCVPYMGVIQVLAEAAKLGFQLGDPSWSNLGQGQPEVGPIPGAPQRLSLVRLQADDHAYGPLAGTDEARQAVADHYNRLYRQGRDSRYGPQHVSLASGGRLALSRIFAALGAGRVGYKLPEYTAYQDLFELNRSRVEPVLVSSREKQDSSLAPEALLTAMQEQQLSAFILSNPCNPTGQVVQGEALAGCVAAARSAGCTLILDEFYSHFIYDRDGGPAPAPVSAARYVQDVDQDPVLLVDGLTKSFRYPGWRVGWVAGPAPMIDMINRVASALDGGPSRPILRLLLEALSPARADQETLATRRLFAKKHTLMEEALQAMGLVVPVPSLGTFYAWASVRRLPPPLNTAQGFFEAALRERVITVPGPFFDVNPGSQRPGPKRFQEWLRFSFGPQEGNLRQGLERLARMIKRTSSRQPPC